MKTKTATSSVVDTNGQGHGALSALLKELGVDILICGGAGRERLIRQGL